MKNLNKIFLILLFVSSFSFCKKENPTSIIIHIVDSVSNYPVVNASVRLNLDALKSSSKGKTIILPTPEKQLTNAEGAAVFNNKYPATYFVHVTKPTKKDTAKSIVKFIENETTEYTIKF